MSPKMHNTAFEASGSDYVYVAMEVRPDNLPAAVDGLRALGFRGFNVIMPHKEAILPLLDSLDEGARISGSVNTVVVGEGGLHGTNTDGSGFVEACEESGVSFAGARVLLVGAGGAAAIAASVLGEGVAELRILNRSPWRAEQLSERLHRAHPDAHITVHALREPVGAALGADVIVTRPPSGWRTTTLCRFQSVTWRRTWRSATPFTGLAARPGSSGSRRSGVCALFFGERMLLYQGIQAQRIWTGKDPDVRTMRDALEGAKTTRVDRQA